VFCHEPKKCTRPIGQTPEKPREKCFRLAQYFLINGKPNNQIAQGIFGMKLLNSSSSAGVFAGVCRANLL